MTLVVQCVGMFYFFFGQRLLDRKFLLAKTHFNVHRTVQLTVRPFRLYLFPKRVLCRQNCCTGRTSVHCLATFGQIFSISFCPPPPPTISSLSVNPAPPPPAPPFVPSSRTFRFVGTCGQFEELEEMMHTP